VVYKDKPAGRKEIIGQ